MRRLGHATLLLIAAAALGPGSALADYQVTIDTSAFMGSTIAMAFDLNDGGPPSNSVSVSGFATDGTLGAVSPSGGVTGSLPGGFTLTDSSFFNEYLQSLTAGKSISYRFGATSNAPAGGSLPDTFSFFLLDPATGLPIFNTTDPTGSASLFELQIDGSPGGLLSTFVGSDTAPVASWTVGAAGVAPVPEPSAGVLLALGGAFLLVASLRRRAHQQREQSRRAAAVCVQ